ncbi:MAG: hypothetical protein E7017_04385 [Alphaproteobacteria bacterium]|nr:hypothetical protein [Alphaproteobacteria bacterium]
MFRIDDIRKSAELAKGKSTRKVSTGESFSEYLKMSSAQEGNNIQNTTAMTSADAIFAAQMVDGEEERQKKQKLLKRSYGLLDRLEEIRDGLLLGSISKDKLIEISRMVKNKNIKCDDEKLREIMEEIELRVEVELAKIMR